MFGKLIFLMFFVAFAGCKNNKNPPNNGPGGHGPPQCNPRNCPRECSFGYVLDENRCQTCECNPDPCTGQICPDCLKCVAVRSSCPIGPCPFVADCVCKSPGCTRPSACYLGYPAFGKWCHVCRLCNLLPPFCDFFKELL